MAKTRKRKASIETSMKVYEQDLTYKYGIDSTAQFIMDGLEERVSPELLELLNAMLLGFSDDMQLEIADDLLDFVCMHVIHTTGCLSADAVLKSCYKWIAEEKGIELTID